MFLLIPLLNHLNVLVLSLELLAIHTVMFCYTFGKLTHDCSSTAFKKAPNSAVKRSNEATKFQSTHKFVLVSGLPTTLLDA